MQHGGTIDVPYLLVYKSKNFIPKINFKVGGRLNGTLLCQAERNYALRNYGHLLEFLLLKC